MVVLGGGGGTGYIHLGGLKLLDGIGARPSLIVGTSMGSIVGAIRARDRDFSVETAHSLAALAGRRSVFKLFHVDNRYGLPAPLRLYLRRAIGDYFRFEDGSPMTLRDLEIPMEVVVAGLRAERMKRDVADYETILPVDAVDAEADDLQLVYRAAGRRGVGALTSVLREFVTDPKLLAEIVLGRCELTRDFDTVDAIGFSAAVPGVIHYDVVRDDPRMHGLIRTLMTDRGVARIVDGGVVNNVPSRVAWEAVQEGRIGTRNAFVLAFDCFAPQLRRNVLFHPVQRLVRRNVKKNEPYAHFTKTFLKVLSPLDLVPSDARVVQAIRDGERALGEDGPFLKEMLAPLPGLDFEYEGRWPRSWEVGS